MSTPVSLPRPPASPDDGPGCLRPRRGAAPAGRHPLRRARDRRRHHRRRRARSTPPPGACAPPWSSATTSPRARRRSRRRWSTAACATSSRATSASSTRPWPSASGCASNAPHLVKVLPFLLPVFGKGGVIPTQAVARPSARPCGCTTSPAARASASCTSASAPTRRWPTCRRCRAERLAASYLYYDARADDARLTLTLARTAAIDYGAVVANRTPRRRRAARTPTAGPAARGSRPTTATATSRVRHRAPTRWSTPAGVWCRRRARARRGHRTPTRSARPRASTSRCRGRRCATTSPWSSRCRKDRRSVFVVPWGDLTYIGTTDTDYDGPLDDPQCTPDDVDYLLGAINDAITGEITDATTSVGTWAGLRPLVRDAGSERTADLSRRHRVHAVGQRRGHRHRRQAHDLPRDGRRHRRRSCSSRCSAPRSLERVAKHSRTRQLPAARRRGLRGAASPSAATAAAHRRRDARPPGQPLRRRGPRPLLAMIERDPTLAEPLVPGPPLPAGRGASTRCATRWPARVDDVLSRRTRARLLARDASAAAAAGGGRARRPTSCGWDDAEQAAPGRGATVRSIADERDARPTCPRPRSTPPLGA